MEFKNFDDYDYEKDEEAETLFIDDDDEFQDARDDNILFDRNKDVKKGKLPFTIDEKRIELQKYFRDSVYNDSLSWQFLDNITFENSATADDEVNVFYKRIEIGTIDLTTKTLTRDMEGIQTSGYQKDHRKIINYRNTTLIGQIEENTGEKGFVNEAIAENIRKKFGAEMKKREGLKDPGEHIEMVQLEEDFKRLEYGKKLETQLGREILDEQITNTRRILEFRKVVEKIPGIGFLFASVAGILTAIILFAKGEFYSASKTLQPDKKKKKEEDPIQKAQEISSEILESAGDDFEILVGVATIALVIFKKRRR